MIKIKCRSTSAPTGFGSQSYEDLVNEVHPVLSCSKKTNNSTVLGPRRINAGVQPLNKNMGPSFRNERVRTSNGFALPEEDISRDFITSAGEQMVVAIVPARQLAMTCNKRLSCSW